jgi:branched-chain amino acid transport system substrate-binding protein
LGLQKAGRDATRGSLIQALESLGDFDLGGLRLRFGPGDRTGSSFVEATIITQGGRFMR